MPYFKNSKDVAQFVEDTIPHFANGSPLTTIIGRSKSGEFFVSIVTDTSLGDIVKKVGPTSSKRPTSTSRKTTQDG